MATRKLGGGVLNFASSSSSLSKGETLLDTALNIQAMRPHGLVVRNSSAGTPHFLSKYLDIPVVNAGDGFHEHPTQALLDAFTMEEKLGSVEGKRIVIIGDIAHSRVARSNIYVLKKLGASVAVCAPPTLMPPKPKETFGVDAYFRIEEILPEADVVMLLRIQRERQNKAQLPSLSEYTKLWGLSEPRAKLMKNGAILMHPGPVNRGVEVAPAVADGPHSVILNQVFNGILVRMAVLSDLCAPEALREWFDSKRK
jgi:aspartate carbamoyltransferase catalytic subunit